MHYLLKELKVGAKQIKDGENAADYKVPSFRIAYGDQQIYSFFLSAEKLLKLVYVFRLQPGNEDAYQRLISPRRISGEGGITEFIETGGFFKTSVVCSFERQVKFEPQTTGLLPEKNIEFGILSIPKVYGSVWIIDGQHRIYGYAGATNEKKETSIGVVAYQDIEKRQQARDFIDINQKQKSVDPNTLWDLLSQTDPSSLRGALTKVAKQLNMSGFFRSQILIPGKAYQKNKSLYSLKLANVCSGLFDRKLLDFNVPNNLYTQTEEVTEEDRYPDSVINNTARALDQYFSLVWDIAEGAPDWRRGFILQNNGFNVFLRVLVEVLKYLKGRWDRSEAKNLMNEPLSKYFNDNYENIKNIRTSTSSEAGRSRAALEIIKCIHEADEDFAAEFIREAKKRERLAFEKTEPYIVLKDLELELRGFIEKSLGEVTDNWWKERIPSDVQINAKQRLEKSDSPWPWVTSQDSSLISYVDFPDYLKIILRRDNWSEIFQKVFKDQDGISSKLRELALIRNKIAHMRSISNSEKIALNLYSSHLKKAIDATKG